MKAYLFHLQYYNIMLCPRRLPTRSFYNFLYNSLKGVLCSIKLFQLDCIVFFPRWICLKISQNIKLVTSKNNTYRWTKIGQSFKMNCKQYYIFETIYVKPKGNDVAALYIAIFVSKQNEFAAQSKRESDWWHGGIIVSWNWKYHGLCLRNSLQ